MDKVANNNLTPEIKCSLKIINTFPDAQSGLVEDLTFILANPPNVTYSEGIFVCELSATNYVQTWEVTSVLDIMLSDVRFAADKIKSIAKKYDAQLLVDIVFYHYDRFPALIFDGSAMRLINYLNADISIDAY